jgi:hypothetical protein
MAPAPTEPVPGNLTVPPLHGWVEIVALLGAVIAVAVAFLVIAAGWSAFSGRSEWQAWLEGRSGRRRDPHAELVRRQNRR